MSDDLGPPPDPRQIAIQAFRQNQFRTRLYAGLSLFFWFLGLAGMLLLIYGLNELVIFIRIADWNSASPPRPGTGELSRWEEQMLWGTDLIHHSMPWLAASVVCLMLAALFTVLLIFSSRQTALKRINISLMQLSEQIKQMKPRQP